MTIKYDITKLNGARNWDISKAEELLKNDLLSNGKEIKTSMANNREIRIDGRIAFAQSSFELRGSFFSSYLHLKLP